MHDPPDFASGPEGQYPVRRRWPVLVSTDSPFGRVQRNLNLVLTSGQYGGDMAFLGAGAGAIQRRWPWCRT